MPHDRVDSETPLVHSDAHARQSYKACEYYWFAGKQGRAFRFTNRSKESYEWTDLVPEDDPDFQGLLEDNEAPFPDISTELPGVPLEEEESDFQVVTDEPEPDFKDLATAALDNAGINTADRLCAARLPRRLRQPRHFGRSRTALA